jgi:hypothetical protein
MMRPQYCGCGLQRNRNCGVNVNHTQNETAMQRHFSATQQYIMSQIKEKE